MSQTVAAIEVVDDLGRKVELASPARRIISLAPHNTENLFSAGAGKWLVATVKFSDYPAAAKNIPRIGNYQQVNYEAVIGLKPDLVVVWASGNPQSMLNRLEKLGLTLFYSEPRRFEQVIDNVRKLSVLAATEADIAADLVTITERYNALRQKYRHKSAVDVFYQVWQQPLITLNGDHLLSQALAVCGGRNIFADLAVIAPVVGIEAIVARDPAVIIRGDGGSNDSINPWWQQWPSLSAVRNRQIYSINPDLLHRHSMRFLTGVEEICRILERQRSSLIG